MAQKVHIILVDDIDGNDADETVSFGLDGASYEIDLTAENAESLREALAPYVGHARRLSGSRRSSGGGRRGRARPADTAGPTAAELREWARENGYEVSERGRVSAEIREAYDAAR